MIGAACALVLSVSACGLKGDLYLPQSAAAMLLR